MSTLEKDDNIEGKEASQANLQRCLETKPIHDSTWVQMGWR